MIGKYQSKLDGSKYFYVSQTIQLKISHLFTYDETTLSQTILFSISFHSV